MCQGVEIPIPGTMGSCGDGATIPGLGLNGLAPLEDPEKSAEFMMYTYKVVPCPRPYGHDWSQCSFSHPGEIRRRRDVRVYQYNSTQCPHTHKFKGGTTCPRGENCKCAHNEYEYWLHPSRYRTKMCVLGDRCFRPVCFFAHSEAELRAPAPPFPRPSKAASNGMSSLAPSSEAGGPEDGGSSTGEGAASSGRPGFPRISSTSSSTSLSSVAAEAAAAATASAAVAAAIGESPAAPRAAMYPGAEAGHEAGHLTAAAGGALPGGGSSCTNSTADLGGLAGLVTGSTLGPALDQQQQQAPTLELLAGLRLSGDGSWGTGGSGFSSRAASRRSSTCELGQAGAGQPDQQQEGVVVQDVDGQPVRLHPDNYAMWRRACARAPQLDSAAAAAGDQNGMGDAQVLLKAAARQQGVGKVHLAQQPEGQVATATTAAGAGAYKGQLQPPAGVSASLGQPLQLQQQEMPVWWASLEAGTIPAGTQPMAGFEQGGLGGLQGLSSSVDSSNQQLAEAAQLQQALRLEQLLLQQQQQEALRQQLMQQQEQQQAAQLQAAQLQAGAALNLGGGLQLGGGAFDAPSYSLPAQTILPSMSAAVDPFGMGNLDLGAAQQQMMYLPGASLANTIPAPSAAMLASVGIMSQDLYAPQQQQQQLVLLPAMATAQQTYGVAAPAPFSFQQQQQQQALQLRLQQQQQRQQALQFGLQQQQQQLAGLMGGPQQHRMQSEQMQLEQMLQAQAAALQQQAHQRGMFGAGHMPHQGGSPRAGQKTNVLLNRLIMATSSNRQLLDLVRDKGACFDFFNTSSAVARVPKLAHNCGGVLQLDHTAKELLDELAALMAAQIDTFDARGLANVVWAWGKIRYLPTPAALTAATQAAISKIGEFGAQHLANVLWACVYLHHRNTELLRLAAEQVVAKVQMFKPQELANAIWAFASLDYQQPELVGAVAARCLELGEAFKEQELSNVLWAFGNLGQYDRLLFMHLLRAARGKLSSMAPQGVAHVAWAMAAVGHYDAPLLDGLLSHCLSHFMAYDLQALTHLLWSCAKLGHQDAAFVGAVLQRCLQCTDRLCAHNLSTIIWSTATLNKGDPAMMPRWTAAVLKRLEAFSAPDLCNVMWGMARMGCKDSELFAMCSPVLLPLLDRVTVPELCDVAWAYAAAEHHDYQLMERIAAEVVGKAAGLTPHSCSQAASAFAALHHQHSALLGSLLRCAAAHSTSFQPSELAVVVWAMARLGVTPGAAAADLGGAGGASALLAAIVAGLPQLSAPEMCQVVWALAVLELLDRAAWRVFCNCLGAAVANSAGLSQECLRQAHHAQLLLASKSAANGGGPVDQAPLPEPVASQARDAYLQWAVAATQASSAAGSC